MTTAANSLKRYLLFAGDTYYPGGGWDDFVDSFDAMDDAIAAGTAAREAPGNSPEYKSWCHVVDRETGERVWDSL